MSKAKKIIICLLGACLIACSGFTAFATTSNVYNIPIAQPQINANSCYLEVVLDNECYLIYATAHGFKRASSVSPVFKAKVIGNYLCIFIRSSLMDLEYPENSTYPVNVEGYYYCGNGMADLYSLTTFVDTSIQSNGYYAGATIQWSGDVVRIHGYNCDVTDVEAKANGDFTFVYGTDSIAHDKLDKIYNSLGTLGGNISSSINSNADKNTSAIQSNNDKNTQSIIDNQNQLAEQEKTETQNSGNNSVNDVSGSVPDKSSGMLSALQSLSNAVSYTGTSAKWTFPQMYIPAISGVTDRINLNNELEIDFTYWINQIPQDIRTIISALSTIGLVVFAFKELYGLISYVLTLKGGGNNE